MLSSHLFRLSKDPTSLTVTPLLYGMNDPAAPPPRISIEYEGDGVEQLVGLHKHDIDECSSAPSRSSKDSSLEGIASDAFTLLLQRAVPSATGAATLASIDTTDSTQQTPGTAVARARSQSDSVTVSSSPSTWHSTPPSLSSSSSSSCLPPQPRSFSSSCRRSAPIPAFILPCTPTPTKQPRQTLSDSNSDNLNVFNTPSAALTAPATPLTALSIEELTPGLAQLRRAFPLPPALRSKDETVDNLTTPTLESRMTEPQQQEVDLFAVSHRLPGAFESFDSLDTVHHHVGDSVARASAGHPNASMYESPRTPTEQSSQHRRSSSYRSTSSFKPSPESISTTSPPSMQKKRSKRALRSKRSKASFRSVDTGEDKELVLDNAYDPSSGYDFRSCPASPSSGQQQQQQQIQRPPHPPRSTSRGSWRSRYSRPETAMSVLTTTETVYEDAVDHFSGDEADAEEDANDLPPSECSVDGLCVCNFYMRPKVLMNKVTLFVYPRELAHIALGNFNVFIWLIHKYHKGRR